MEQWMVWGGGRKLENVSSLPQSKPAGKWLGTNRTGGEKPRSRKIIKKSFFDERSHQVVDSKWSDLRTKPNEAKMTRFQGSGFSGQGRGLDDGRANTVRHDRVLWREGRKLGRDQYRAWGE
jgi:hypothetical protein